MKLRSVSDRGRFANALARRGSPLAGVNEAIGSKLKETAGGRFFAWLVLASAGDRDIPATTHSAATKIPVDPRSLGNLISPFTDSDIVRTGRRFHARNRFILRLLLTHNNVAPRRDTLASGP